MCRTRIDISLGKVYRKSTAVVQKVLEKCGLAPTDITEVLRAGGASRTPKVQSAIEVSS
jgi:molecular chaperone DnaK (HSP70)